MPVPSVSGRKHICVPPGQAEDPTSSLVLMSHRGYYVDIRVRRGRTPKESELPNEGGPVERLLLARAGRHIPSDNGQTRERCAEWIQGMKLSSDDASDKKLNKKGKTRRANSEAVDSVVGQAVIDDPVTGEAIKFDELSIDLPISPNRCDGRRTSIVLLLKDEEREVRGMVVRVGGWCQGLLQIGHDISVERWKWVVGREPAKRKRGHHHQKNNKEEYTATLRGRDVFAAQLRPSSEAGRSGRRGEWERQVRIGSRLVPCGLTLVESIASNALDAVQEGALVQAGDMTWTVVERYVW